jgi:nitroreductase/NAD-dependent dihydropyrimidine dehydrogenase PreA subunit
MHSLYRESGTVRIDEAVCTHCGECARICPAEVLVAVDGKIRIRSDSAFGCMACGHCMMVCPVKAVTVSGRGMSPEDLAPMPEPGAQAGADALEALMRARRSVRRFTDREVETGMLDRIVEMASTAPMGIPPWDIGCVKVCGRAGIQRIAAEVIKGYAGFLKVFRPWLLAVMRPFVGKARYDMFAHFVRPLAEGYVRARREGRDVLFYDAPALLIFHHSPYADPVDAAIAVTYAMLAAESMGLGSTIIGGAPPILQRNQALCRRLGIPPGNTPCTALILGYPATRFRHTIRRRFAQVTATQRQRE